MIKRKCLLCDKEMLLNNKQGKKKYCGSQQQIDSCSYKVAIMHQREMARQFKGKYSYPKARLELGWLNF